MIRYVKFAMLAALAFGMIRAARAQTWFPVAQESDSTTLTLPANSTYQIGTTSCPSANNSAAWSAPVTVAADTTFSPLSMGVPSQFPFSDPCLNFVKTLQVQETSAPQILTLNGAPFTVPALASATAPPAVPVALNSCPAPATSNANPKLPAAPPNCAPLANLIAVCGDGCSITETHVAAPVIFQYCQGTGTGHICAAPFMFVGLPIKVGPNARCGGPPTSPAASGTASPGTLYVVESGYETRLQFSAPDGTPQAPFSVPAPATN